MSEKKPVHANFPERGLKVVIGPYINATNTKLLRKLTIGTYEMSVHQQEKIGSTVENARVALTDLAKERGLQFELVEHRDCAGAFKAEGPAARLQVWIGTPFESGQTTHLLWAQYTDPSKPRHLGVAFKLNTAFSIDDIVALCKKAQDNARDLEADEAFEIIGNPPPRFQKKAKEGAAPAEGAEPVAADEAPDAPAGAAPIAGDPPGGD